MWLFMSDREDSQQCLSSSPEELVIQHQLSCCTTSKEANHMRVNTYAQYSLEIMNTLFSKNARTQLQYSRHFFLQSPLDAGKPSLKQHRWSVKRGSLRHAHARSSLFFSSNSMWKAFSKPSQNTCNCMHWYLTSLLFKVCTKFQAYIQAYNKVHVLVCSTVVPYSCTCKWLCVCKIWWSLVTSVWQVVAQQRKLSAQNHPCTEFQS